MRISERASDIFRSLGVHRPEPKWTDRELAIMRACEEAIADAYEIRRAKVLNFQPITAAELASQYIPRRAK